mmetsp:Transcript_9368/g.15525  ORF Transcript_9368/g.15525 Transcript_9368/m.15525 type:complete len:861 (+) Transcript_9368:97-2679(+)|eukprot:scaffold9079_cov145-Skeletonema_menzelii.AAC.11
MNGNGHHANAPQALVIDARPKTYSIDVRVFVASIMATMVVAFGSGLMMGPTDARLAVPVLSFLGIELPELVEAPPAAIKSEPIVGAMSTQSLMPSNLQAKNSNSKSATYMIGEVSADGAILVHKEGDDAAGEVMIKQAKRTKTEHVATLGYKIRETHFNIDTPVLEGTGDVPHEREITYDSINKENDGNIRDQTMPSGQHLLVDMKNLEADFLNSESRLARAMQDSVIAGGLTMLSYHCHSLHPAGVSCVGVLLESHISFHTWPDEGVITLDMFTTSEKPLLPVLPSIKELFGIPRVNAETGEKEEVVTVWSHELRGFRTEDARKVHHLDGNSDISKHVTSPLEVVYKEHILHTQTEFSRIDIWDVKERDDTPSYEDGLRLGLAPQDPRWFSYEDKSPCRLLFLDGVLHMDNETDRVFHEALVQPAMFAHPSPRSVGILGGGDGGSLREVLKHKSVTDVTMVELDEKVVSVSKEYMPEISDCSDIVGSTPSCFDDDRLNLVFTDAFAYVKDKVGSKEANGKFDVLVADVNQPENQIEYTDADTVDALVESLSPLGVLVINAGEAPLIVDPRADKGMQPKREAFTKLLEAHPKIASIFVYEDAESGYAAPVAFLVACRDSSCRKRWYGQTDEINYQVFDRLQAMKSKKPALIQFDGATQRSYQIPPRAWETVYCRREPEPFECTYRGLDMTKQLFEYYPSNEDESAFVIRESKEGAEDDAAVYATVDIPEGSYIMPTHLAASLEISEDSAKDSNATAHLEGTGEADVLTDFVDYIDENGHSARDGSGKIYVEIGGSSVIRESDDASEVNIRRWIPVHPDGARPKYSPVYDRHRHSFDVFLVASRDIKAGEEIVKPADLWDH